MKFYKTIFIVFTTLVIALAGPVGIPMMAIQKNYTQENENKKEIEITQVEEEPAPSIEEAIQEIADVEIITEETNELVDVEAISDPAAMLLEEEVAQVTEDITALPAEIKYTTTGVHLRAGPTTESEIVNTFSINTELEKIGTEGDWTIVRYNNTKNYIFSQYLSDTKTEIASRSSTEEREGNFLGYYTLTYYCSCSKCCGSYTNGITASGKTAQVNHTVAVPPGISLGTTLKIGDSIYVAEDRGGAIKGNKIDVYVGSHSEAMAKGVTRNVPVWAIK